MSNPTGNNPVAQEIGQRLATKELLAGISEVAREASAAILQVYALPFDVTHKDDKSPVTAADHAAEAIILKGLKELTPNVAVIAEEEMAAGREPDTKAGVFWLVDPLDGTKEFVKKNGEFTVNIALIADGRAVLGVVLAPATQTLWRGLNWGDAPYAELLQGDAVAQRIAVRPPSPDGITVFASRTHGSYRDPDLEDFLAQFKIAERKQAGSSLKFCRIAEGEADLYPRLGPTMEWDTAAGQAVLEAAGGRVTTIDGDAFTYGKPSFRNPHFVAWGWRK